MSSWADEPLFAKGGVSSLKPDAFFAQLGVADEVTSGTGGAIWNVPWDALGPRWSMYVEASVSRWQSRGGYPAETGILTQLALIPVFRYRLDEGRSRWFLEGGIGATVTSSVYRGGESRFSTSFNFGDHAGVGYSFGERRNNELVLRVEHFSNAGIKHPNPGKNFLELRYVRHFD
ncbi:acyloxyacyl hydrolase [Piscinibacter sp. XHJ-5]|uniref:acyloxyacyl hydrolase n=1 Tax=Piscinibacter sp. XHJ-5 TaxID=3037797 RepID=UPI00245315D4|nr:acyloxyacyl hydrolase [Piscinibacter sp. XHJ-5]